MCTSAGLLRADEAKLLIHVIYKNPRFPRVESGVFYDIPNAQLHEDTERSKQEGLKQVLSLLFVYFPLHPLDSHLKEEVDQVLVRTFSADTT